MNLKRKSEKLSSAISSVWINLKSIKGRSSSESQANRCPLASRPRHQQRNKTPPSQDQSIWYQHRGNTCSLNHGNVHNKCLKRPRRNRDVHCKVSPQESCKSYPNFTCPGTGLKICLWFLLHILNCIWSVQKWKSPSNSSGKISVCVILK